MNISSNGLILIKTFEGYKNTAYQDVVGVWTIGYGTTKNVHAGMVVTLQQAEDMLRQDVAAFEAAVTKLVTVPINQNKFDALVSFAYNLGVGSLAKSTLLVYVNSGKFDKAALEFSKWNRAGGKVVQGLTNRRELESILFQKV